MEIQLNLEVLDDEYSAENIWKSYFFYKNKN